MIQFTYCIKYTTENKEIENIINNVISILSNILDKIEIIITEDDMHYKESIYKKPYNLYFAVNSICTMYNAYEGGSLPRELDFLRSNIEKFNPKSEMEGLKIEVYNGNTDYTKNDPNFYITFEKSN